MILYNGAGGTQSSTLTNPDGTTDNYTNPWKFQPTATPKWSFQDNVNDYAEKVIGDEIEGGLQTQE